MIISGFHTMIYDNSNLFSKFVIISEESSAIAIAAQIFRWEERGATYCTYSSRLFHTSIFKEIISADCLSIIFNNIKIMTLSDIQNSLHISTLSKNMHRDNSLSFRSYSAFYSFRINIICIFFNIYQYRCKTK